MCLGWGSGGDQVQVNAQRCTGSQRVKSFSELRVQLDERAGDTVGDDGLRIARVSFQRYYDREYIGLFA